MAQVTVSLGHFENGDGTGTADVVAVFDDVTRDIASLSITVSGGTLNVTLTNTQNGHVFQQSFGPGVTSTPLPASTFKMLNQNPAGRFIPGSQPFSFHIEFDSN